MGRFGKADDHPVLPVADKQHRLPPAEGGKFGKVLPMAKGDVHERKWVGWMGEAPPDNTITIVETFTSIQGEGNLLGVPSHFIRTSQCNLRCSWCDTTYSFDPERDGHQVRSVESLVQGALESGVKHVVITGGEPTIQPHLGALVMALKAEDFHITVESNATVYRGDCLGVDLWSFAPKLSGSNTTFDHEVMRNYAELIHVFQNPDLIHLKFVCAKPEIDLPHAVKFVREYFPNENMRPAIWMHPNGMVPDDQYATECRELAEYVLAHTPDDMMLKVGLQYHRLMWGHTLGT